MALLSACADSPVCIMPGEPEGIIWQTEVFSPTTDTDTWAACAQVSEWTSFSLVLIERNGITLPINRSDDALICINELSGPFDPTVLMGGREYYFIASSPFTLVLEPCYCDIAN